MEDFLGKTVVVGNIHPRKDHSAIVTERLTSQNGEVLYKIDSSSSDHPGTFYVLASSMGERLGYCGQLRWGPSDLPYYNLLVEDAISATHLAWNAVTPCDSQVRWTRQEFSFMWNGERCHIPLCNKKRFLPVGGLYLAVKRFFDPEIDAPQVIGSGHVVTSPDLSELLYWLSIRKITIPEQFIFSLIMGERGTSRNRVPLRLHSRLDKDTVLSLADWFTDEGHLHRPRSYGTMYPEIVSREVYVPKQSIAEEIK
jgi:hypothetical protein